jgi:hypothetical protein
MDQQLRRYMGMGEFGRHIGLSHFMFRRLCDRYQIPTIDQGRYKYVEVEPAARMLAHVPGIEALMSKQGLELIRGLGETPQVEEVAE